MQVFCLAEFPREAPWPGKEFYKVRMSKQGLLGVGFFGMVSRETIAIQEASQTDLCGHFGDNFSMDAPMFAPFWRHTPWSFLLFFSPRIWDFERLAPGVFGPYTPKPRVLWRIRNEVSTSLFSAAWALAPKKGAAEFPLDGFKRSLSLLDMFSYFFPGV